MGSGQSTSKHHNRSSFVDQEVEAHRIRSAGCHADITKLLQDSQENYVFNGGKKIEHVVVLVVVDAEVKPILDHLTASGSHSENPEMTGMDTSKQNLNSKSWVFF